MQDRRMKAERRRRRRACTGALADSGSGTDTGTGNGNGSPSDSSARPRSLKPRIEMASEWQMQTRCRIALAEPLSVAVPARARRQQRSSNGSHHIFTPNIFPTSSRSRRPLPHTASHDVSTCHSTPLLTLCEPTQTAIPDPPSLGVVRSTLTSVRSSPVSWPPG